VAIYEFNSMRKVGSAIYELLSSCFCFGCLNSATGEMDLQLLETIELASFGQWGASVNLIGNKKIL